MQNDIKYGDFTDDVIADKMSMFLNNLVLFPTTIGELDKSGQYIYTGIDYCHGEKEESSGKLLRSIGNITITGGNVFTKTAKRAVYKGNDQEAKDLLEKIENFKLIPFPVSIDSKIVTDTKVTGFELTRIQAEYQERTKRAPLRYLYNTGRFVLSSYLTKYMKKWRVQGVGSMDTCEELEFSTGNYIKTLIFHAGGKVLIIDCHSVYQGEDKPNGELLRIGRVEMLDKMIANKHIASEFISYFTVPTIGNIFNHTRWIVPYLCGDEKHISLDANGKVVKEESAEEKETV